MLGDATISNVHADATSQKHGEPHAIGRSHGGPAIRLHVAVDGLGLPLRSTGSTARRPRGGLRASPTSAKSAPIPVTTPMPDAVPPPKTRRDHRTDQRERSRIGARPLDLTIDKERYPIEYSISKISYFHRIARRCQQTLPSSKVFVDTACAMARPA